MRVCDLERVSEGVFNIFIFILLFLVVLWSDATSPRASTALIGDATIGPKAIPCFAP